MKHRTRWIIEAIVVAVGLLPIGWALVADRNWYERHIMWTSCTYEPFQFGGFRRWRWAFAILGAIVVLVLRPIFGRRAAGKPPGEVLGAWGRAGLAVLLSLVSVEVILRVVDKPPKQGRLEMPLAVRDPTVGWLPDPGKSEVVTYRDPHPPPGTTASERVIEYVTDAAGNRVRSAAEPTDVRKPAILFPGESITLGLGIPYDDTYVAKVARATGIEGVDLAVTAYSSDQAYVRLRQQLPRFDKPVAVVTLVVAAALLRNVDRRIGHLLPEPDGSLRAVPPTSDFFFRSPLRDLVERKVGLHSGAHLDIARNAIAATARDARARGAYPLFVFTNWGMPCLPADDGGPPPLEHVLFDGLDVPFVRVELPSSTWDATIDHPGVAAHELLAARMTEALAKAGVAPTRPSTSASPRSPE